MKKFLSLLVGSLFFFISCSDDDTPPANPGPSNPDPVNYSSGSADFSTYVAVGNSLTAGYSDGALFMDGQTASFPNMLAASFAEAGGGTFTIPFMADNLGGLTLAGNALPGFENRLILSFASGSPSPVRLEGTGSTEITNTLSGPFNNMGVPGAKIYHLAASGYGSLDALAINAANPYYVRFASAPDATIIGDAVSQNPTFFTLWIGNNDLLSYATQGGDGVDQNGNTSPATYGPNDITDPDVFTNLYNQLLQALTAGGAKGAVANIPDVTALPYFTTVPHAPLDPTNPDFASQIPRLNDTFGRLNSVFDFLGQSERSIVFATDAASAVVIRDKNLVDLSAQISQVLQVQGFDAQTAGLLGSLYGQVRQANAEDLIVLPARNVIGEVNEEAFAMFQGLGLSPAEAGQFVVNGVTYPLEDKWVLTLEEQQTVAMARTAFNTTISTLAGQYDIPVVDTAALLNEADTDGIPLSDGSLVTADFATGGGFSLDGVHLSPRGYALVANRFIAAIETAYGAELPEVDPLAYTGLYIN